MVSLSREALDALIESAEFSVWWESLCASRADLAALDARHNEMRVQASLMSFRSETAHRNGTRALSDAARHEHVAAEYAAEAAVVENKAFEALAAFETQREHTSKAWADLSAAEIGELRAELPALKAHYDNEARLKESRWVEVERLWERQLELSLLADEHQARAAHERARAQHLFEEVEQKLESAKKLESETEGLVAEIASAKDRCASLRERAAERFGCTVGEDFLYFGCAEPAGGAWAVPLTAEGHIYGVLCSPLKPFHRGAGRRSAPREGSEARSYA